MAELVLAILFGSVVIVLVWRGYDRYQAYRLVRLRGLADDFYPRAEAALDHLRMNPDLLHFVVMISASVEHPDEHAWMWVRSMLYARRHGLPPQDTSKNPLIQEFEFGGDCVDVVLSGLLLVAELKPLAGIIIRREVMSLKRKMERDPSKAPPVMRRWIDQERHLEAA